MIYTITFAPSVDYSVFLNKLEIGEINRVKKQIITPGGKGINVSLILAKLGVNSVATGFIGGFTGKYVKHELNALGVANDFVEVDGGTTRINVKINTKEETAINGNGIKVDKLSFMRLIEKVSDYDSDDIVVISGSVPKYDFDAIDLLLEEINKKNIKFIVDITGKNLIYSLKYHPFLVKPNKSELEESLGIKIKSNEDLLKASKELLDQGAENVIVSLGADGAFMIGKNLKPIYVKPYEGNAKSSVGAGDSLLAGFIYEYLRTKDMSKALKCGVYVGAATVYSDGLASDNALENALAKL